jgi:hypothetical protein
MFGLRSVKVVFSQEEAKKLNLPIDHDDSHVWEYDRDFAILLHGTQPKGSAAGKAWYKLQKAGKSGYRAGYFDHYTKNGKTKSKVINGKHIHFKPGKPVITVNGVQIKPSAVRKVNPLRKALHV